MKKLFRNILFMAIATAAYVACSDVEEPYDLPGKGSNALVEPDSLGAGTATDPFNCWAALKKGKQLANGESTTEEFYIKGKVVSIALDKTTKEPLNYNQGTFGNATFYISDDGTEKAQFYCYRLKYLKGAKWTSEAGPILYVGDNVIVKCKLYNYQGTIENKDGSLYSLNGNTGN
jgi:hypothetical protein